MQKMRVEIANYPSRKAASHARATFLILSKVQTWIVLKYIIISNITKEVV